LARHYPQGLRIDPHAHTWSQVLYAVAGVMWVEVGREALVVPPQRAVWLPPGTVHSIHMMSAVKMRNLYLHEENVQHLSKHSDVFEINELLRELITTIAERELVRDSEYLQTAYRFAAMELGHAARYSMRIPLPDESDRRLDVLCRAVIENPSVGISFEQHAASVGASVRTLSRLFTRALGLGFAEWRRQGASPSIRWHARSAIGRAASAICSAGNWAWRPAISAPTKHCAMTKSQVFDSARMQNRTMPHRDLTADQGR
jgi:hypothetical protein